MVENSFKLFFKGDVVPEPDIVREAFIRNFPDAINIEWLRIDKIYEAIFYDGSIEKIAKFTENGEWIETMTNLDVTVLDGKVRKSAEQYGEIMSSIEIETEELKKFEIIIRDKQLNRFLLIMSSNGEVQSNNLIA